MANNQEKFHEIIIFYKKNILDLFLRKQEILVTFARKALLGMKIQEVMKLFVFFSDQMSSKKRMKTQSK